MTNIKTHLKTINFATELDAVNNLVDCSRAQVTFWGKF